MTFLKRVFGGTLKNQGRTMVAKKSAKLVASTFGRATAKVVTKTAASPWLLAADAAELGVERVGRALDCDEETTRVVAKGTGLATSLGVGFAVGGPVGAATAAGLWGVGQAVAFLFE